MIVVHRMPVVCMTMIRTLITKVMIGSPFRASSALVVGHSWRSEPSLEMLLLCIGVQRRILLVPTMLVPITLHGQSLMVGHARVVCGARVDPPRRRWTTLMLLDSWTLFGIRESGPSWWSRVRVLLRADAWSVRTIADTMSALRPPRILPLRNLLIREISGIVPIGCAAIACWFCHWTIVGKEFERRRDSSSSFGDCRDRRRSQGC